MKSGRNGQGNGGDRARQPIRVRPSVRRQVLLAAVAVAALAAGYLAANLLGGRDEPPDMAIGTVGGEVPLAPPRPAPWYATQAPPPALVTGPNAPMYPEPADKTAETPRRAYEEALPAEVHDAPPQPPLPPPAPASASVPQTAPSAPLAAPSAVPAWRQYAVAAGATDGRPMIAIVIDDMGMDRKRSARAVALPGPVTLSFLTYADDLDHQTAAARAAGHELLLHVGMEPSGAAGVDPGPNVLLAGEPPEEIRRRLAWGLDRAHGYVGINNHMGSKFTADSRAMEVVMEELRARGLLFLDSRTTPHSVGTLLARRVGVPVLERNVFLDNVNEIEAVNARLSEVEQIARRHGAAIAIGHPRDATLAALAAWIPRLRERGFVLVPLTAILRPADQRGPARAG